MARIELEGCNPKKFVFWVMNMLIFLITQCTCTRMYMNLNISWQLEIK